MAVNVTGSQIHTVRFVETFGVISHYYPGGTRQYFSKSHDDLEIMGLEDSTEGLGDRELWRFVGTRYLSSGSNSWRWILTGKISCENVRVPRNFKGWQCRSCLGRFDGCNSWRLHVFHNLSPSGPGIFLVPGRWTPEPQWYVRPRLYLEGIQTSF